MDDIFAVFARVGVIPVVVLDDASSAVPVCNALMEGGLNVAEITFRTASAADSIRRISRQIPEMTVGAGTVLTVEHAQEALEAGARFIVTPGFNSRVVEYCLDSSVTIAPGCSTATDMTKAVEHGLGVVKFFPAEAIGGLKTLRALAAPFGMLRFIPTGGIDPHNIREYLGFEKVLACGGTWMVKPDIIRSGDYSLIVSASRRCVEFVREFRDMEKAVKG